MADKKLRVTAEQIEAAVEGFPELKSDLINYSLGFHTDGLLYIFHKGTPIGNGVSVTGDVVGNVDSANNIIVTGALANGTYSVKYEMDDGTTIDIGELVLDRNIYYSITNNLTNCVNSNSATRAIKGERYSATITANDGYELSSVNVAMGGVDITESAVIGGAINIASVSGNIAITAVAVASGPSYTNQIPLSTDANGNPFNGGQGWKTGYRLSLSSGNESGADGYECTGFIPATQTDSINVKDIDLTEENATNLVCYDSIKQPIAVNGTNYGISLYSLFVTYGTEVNGAYTASLNSVPFLTFHTDVAFIRIGSKSITDNSILTVNQDIL